MIRILNIGGNKANCLSLVNHSEETIITIIPKKKNHHEAVYKANQLW